MKRALEELIMSHFLVNCRLRAFRERPAAGRTVRHGFLSILNGEKEDRYRGRETFKKSRGKHGY